ncbi:MAG TPA: substrate-binding domain-containing protein [Usitatibacter sp.]|nr:substrate-binding domain-containing protein [Usitatibacter sp.]
MATKISRTKPRPGRLRRPSANAVTARDVARAAGVSLATVSRALNDNPAVDARLRARVEAAARRLNYTPHAAARALASQRTRAIGAVIPTLESQNFSLGVQALQRRIGEAGYTLLLASSNYDPKEELRQVKALAAHGVDAMMLVGRSHERGVYELLNAKGIPFVNTWVLDTEQPCVGFDNRQVGRMLATYLMDLGHTEIGMIAQRAESSDRSADRVAGVRQALHEHGLRLREDHLQLIERPHKIAEGQLALRELLKLSRRPTAIICGTDTLAFGALLECERLGVGVPREMSIAGINDVELAAHLNPPLTSVRLAVEEIGARAAEYLLGRVKNLAVARLTEVEVSLIVRASTAPPRARRSREQ